MENFSKEELFDDLTDGCAENIIEKLFAYFHIDCFVIQNLDIQTFENLILKLTKAPSSDKKIYFRKSSN